MQIIKLDTDILRFVYTTDWHLTDQPPGRRTKGYREEIMAKVEFVRDLTVKLRAVGLFGGDMFHSKHPRAQGNTFSLLARLETTLRGFYLGYLPGTHGNHDLYMDRIDSIPHQPIGSLIASGALRDLSTGSMIFENRDGSSRVQVDSYPYTSDDLYALDRVLNAPPREEGVTHRIVLMHQYGNPGNNPHMHDTPTIGFNRMAECDYDFALWGHDHSRTETVTVGKCTHVRLGSLSRASLADDEVDREVAAAVLSFKGTQVGFKEVPIPVQPLKIAFVTADREIEKVKESVDVVTYLREMDLAVEGIESSDPREVMKQIALAAIAAAKESTGQTLESVQAVAAESDGMKIFDLAADCCAF